MNTINITILDELEGSPYAVTTEDGGKLFERIKSVINENNKVELDFSDINLIITTFLNASIGQLYSVFTPEQIRDHLVIKNMSDEDLAVLKLVVDRAKDYFTQKDIEEIYKSHFPDGQSDS